MFIHNRFVSGIYKLVTAILGFLGLSLSLGLFRGEFNGAMFHYFTNLSNLVTAGYFLCAGVFQLSGRRETTTLWPTVKGMVTMGLTVTMLIAHFMLGGFTMGGSPSLSLMLLHYVCPLLVLLDWVLFDEKGQVKPWSPALWVAAPLVYLVYAMIAGGIGDGIGMDGSRYPYPFLDVDVLGAAGVARWVVILLVAFLLLGYVFYAVDRLAAHRAARK